jgi:hypothetical protein
MHPPLLIPWEDIQAEPRNFLWLKLMRLTFSKAPGKGITVRAGDFDEMKAYLKSS